ncbi:MAG: hypothetical protein JWO31_964 [Phycisphaerales bacterium]|nr:hypothetical protein [Phycisphaerales bacterium]
MTRPAIATLLLALTAPAAAVPAAAAAGPATAPAATRPAEKKDADKANKKEQDKVPVEFAGGHEIGKGDFGRPVPLIAAALGVKDDVFRQAFSGVTPAHGRGPSPDEARKNKDALLKVLAPHGVTNDRMDEVANRYRFRPQEGELWPTAPAKAYAVVKDGKVLKVVVTEPGIGYSSPPDVTVDGAPAGTAFKATLHFDKDFKKNGAVGAIDVVPPPH